jgi:oxygen-independent coproporphyrinogen III oxidase
MSGIYIHIPFCKKACHYCNFHFSTNLSLMDNMVDAICRDLELRKNYLKSDEINTLYFGGGTPSILKAFHVEKIFDTIRSHFKFSDHAEITFECNPDDISYANLELWKRVGVNRLSIGIQSFFEDDLLFTNRAHSAAEGIAAINLAKEFDFHNLSVDLIYGLTTSTEDKWKKNIEIVLDFDIPHVSAYCLTIEEKTVFGNWVRNKKMQKPSDELANSQFDYLIDTLIQKGYHHYEISNFALPDQYAVHNTNYWRGIEYLGLGPAAHSFNGKSRSWAIANNALYINNISLGLDYVETEVLSIDDEFNEFMMTGLRTMWGIDLNIMEAKFGQQYLLHIHDVLKSENILQYLIMDNNQLVLNKLGKFYADHVASTFFRINED